MDFFRIPKLFSTLFFRIITRAFYRFPFRKSSLIYCVLKKTRVQTFMFAYGKVKLKGVLKNAFLHFGRRNL